MEIPVYTKECLEGVVSLVFTVTEEMIDSNGIMRLGDLARKMQEATELHMESCVGINAEKMTASGKSWVICFTDIENKRLPKLGELVELRIWAGKNKSVMYTRKYAMYTAEGEPLMSACSLFLLMDQKTRSMAAAPEQVKNCPIAILDGEKKPPKMVYPFPEEYRNKVTRIVVPEEIDYNGHLNNAHYLDWMEDLMDDAYTAKHNPKSIWIQYTKELREGDQVQLEFEWQDQAMYLRGSDERDVSFLLKAEYEV